MKKDKPTILVIFGITGDLAGRYLLSAIKAIAKAKMLPRKFKIVGITRKSGTEFYQMDITSLEDYAVLGEHLKKIEKKFGAPAQRLFYLSVPPEASKPIVELLGRSGLAKEGETKLLLEKPFGTDLVSAKDLVKNIEKYFNEDQVYRIDHYLAKEAAQNIIIFRNGNSLFKKTWNKDFIESIEIIASEKIGIEGRAHFYEQTGALRDYVQSHLLQLSALVLMELPDGCALDEIPRRRLEALDKLKVACDMRKKKCVLRGQYMGYRKEVGNPKSMVETFVSVSLISEDPRWRGVPITITTGKALDERFTEIRIRYKKTEEHESNELILRLQPNPGIEFSVFAKKPGYERELSMHTLHFNFKEYYSQLPEAYEQVIWSAINSDHSLFAGSGEVLASWKILDVVQKAWKKSKGDLVIYKKGIAAQKIS